MLIEFSIGNYRSFKERVTLSMEAADIASQPSSLDTHNVFTVSDDLHLLTSAAIYGANASGKSNIILALNFMRYFVINSSRETQVGEKIPCEPYLLCTVTEDQPSEFEVVFLVNGVQYRYAFSITEDRIINESLFRLGNSREITLFSRKFDTIKVNTRTFREGKGLENRTRPNALFLSVVAQFNGMIATDILQWWIRLGINIGVTDEGDMLEAYHYFEHSPYQKAMEELIRRLDVGISRLTFEREPAQPPPFLSFEATEQFRVLFDTFSKRGTPLENISIQTFHQRYDVKGLHIDEIAFDLEQQESAGTKRLFTLAYPIIRTLQEGLVLVIDEIDARIHPNLVLELIRLFNNPETNPHHAQIIFTTHNTNLLSAKLFRRDQIWFMEKSRQGVSDLYSLVEYRVDGKIIRNDASFEKDYIAGRYGAVPFIGDLSALLGATHGQEAAS